MSGTRRWLFALATATVVMAGIAVMPGVASANWWEPGQAELENDRTEFPDWVEATEVTQTSATLVARFLPNWPETHWVVQMKGPMCVFHKEAAGGVRYEELSRCEGGELDEEPSPAEREYHSFSGWSPDPGAVLGEGVVVGGNPDEFVVEELPTAPVRTLVPGQKYLAYVRTWNTEGGAGPQSQSSDNNPPAFSTQELTKQQLREKKKKEALERRAKHKLEQEEARRKRREEKGK